MMAWRVRQAVAGRKWKEIAEDEAARRGIEDVDPDSIRKTVYDWVEELRIPFHRRVPGRPRKEH